MDASMVAQILNIFAELVYDFPDVTEKVEMVSFKETYLKGECTIEELDDYVDTWHKGSTGKSLQNFLGFSNEEYAAFGRGETIIKKLLDSQKYSDKKVASVLKALAKVIKK